MYRPVIFTCTIKRAVDGSAFNRKAHSAETSHRLRPANQPEVASFVRWPVAVPRYHGKLPSAACYRSRSAAARRVTSVLSQSPYRSTESVSRRNVGAISQEIVRSHEAPPPKRTSVIPEPPAQEIESNRISQMIAYKSG